MFILTFEFQSTLLVLFCLVINLSSFQIWQNILELSSYSDVAASFHELSYPIPLLMSVSHTILVPFIVLLPPMIRIFTHFANIHCRYSYFIHLIRVRSFFLN